jgi:hypothetical protein
MPYRRNQSPLNTCTDNHISVFQPYQADLCGLQTNTHSLSLYHYIVLYYIIRESELIYLAPQLWCTIVICGVT